MGTIDDGLLYLIFACAAFHTLLSGMVSESDRFHDLTPPNCPGPYSTYCRVKVILFQ